MPYRTSRHDSAVGLLHVTQQVPTGIVRQVVLAATEQRSQALVTRNRPEAGIGPWGFPAQFSFLLSHEFMCTFSKHLLLARHHCAQPWGSTDKEDGARHSWTSRPHNTCLPPQLRVKVSNILL